MQWPDTLLKKRAWTPSLQIFSNVFGKCRRRNVNYFNWACWWIHSIHHRWHFKYKQLRIPLIHLRGMRRCLYVKCVGDRWLKWAESAESNRSEVGKPIILHYRGLQDLRSQLHHTILDYYVSLGSPEAVSCRPLPLQNHRVLLTSNPRIMLRTIIPLSLPYFLTVLPKCSAIQAP